MGFAKPFFTKLKKQMPYGNTRRRVRRVVRSVAGRAISAISSNPLGYAAKAAKLAVHLGKRKRVGGHGGNKLYKVIGKVHQDGTGTSRSFDYMGKKAGKMGKMNKMQKNLQIYDVLTATTLDTGASGQQAVASLNTMLADGGTLSNVYNTNLTKVGSSATTNSNLPEFLPGQKSLKMYLQEVNQFVTFTNMTNSNITVDIYDCCAKRDRTAQVYPDTDWNNGVRFDQEGSVATTGYPNTTPYQTPYQSVLFNQFWRVVKQTHVELAQGRSHEHIIKDKANKTINLERTAGSLILGGTTKCVLLVVRGLPCTATSSATTATLAEAKIAVVYRTQYKWRVIDTVPSIYTEFGTLSGLAGTLLSEGSGVIVPVAEA